MSIPTQTRTPVGDFITNLQLQLSKNYYDIEVNRRVVIPSSVRQFLESVVIESVTLRPDEWMQIHHLDCNTYTDLQRIIPLAADTVSGLLYRVAPEVGSDQLTIVGVLEVVAKNWCGIFPFCR